MGKRKRRRGTERKQNAKEEIINWLAPKHFLIQDLKKFADQKNWKGVANTITKVYVKENGGDDGTCNLLMNSLHTKDLWEKLQAVQSGETGTSGLYKTTRGPPKEAGAAWSGTGKHLTKKKRKALAMEGPSFSQDNTYLQKLERENAEMKRMLLNNMAGGGGMGGRGGMGMGNGGAMGMRMESMGGMGGHAGMGGSAGMGMRGGVGIGIRGSGGMGGSGRMGGSGGMGLGGYSGMGMRGSSGIGMGGSGGTGIGGSVGMGMGWSGGTGMGGSSMGMQRGGYW